MYNIWVLPSPISFAGRMAAFAMVWSEAVDRVFDSLKKILPKSSHLLSSTHWIYYLICHIMAHHNAQHLQTESYSTWSDCQMTLIILIRSHATPDDSRFFLRETIWWPAPGPRRSAAATRGRYYLIFHAISSLVFTLRKERQRPSGFRGTLVWRIPIPQCNVSTGTIWVVSLSQCALSPCCCFWVGGAFHSILADSRKEVFCSSSVQKSQLHPMDATP